MSKNGYAGRAARAAFLQRLDYANPPGGLTSRDQ